MNSKSSKERDEEHDVLDIWRIIKQKLEEKGQTIDWLSEQVPQGKKTFNWYYGRKRINTDMLYDISTILDHKFFKYYSDRLEIILEKKKAENVSASSGQ